MAGEAGSAIDNDGYERLALADGDHLLELHDGVLAEKIIGTTARNNAVVELAFQLIRQLDRTRLRVRIDSTRVKSDRSYIVPDVLVVPVEATAHLRDRFDRLEVYAVPLPFVSESFPAPENGRGATWRLRLYMARGDLEIWRMYPFERKVVAWRRQPDGSYARVVFPGGTVEVAPLPGVTIDLDDLFAG